MFVCLVPARVSTLLMVGHLSVVGISSNKHSPEQLLMYMISKKLYSPIIPTMQEDGVSKDYMSTLKTFALKRKGICFSSSFYHGLLALL